MSTDFLSHNAGETLAFARRLAETEFQKGSVILLRGSVGAGKTVFTRGFVSAWGLDNLVTSPTFTLMNEYKNEEVWICHFDFYRLSGLDEIRELGIEDYLSQCDYSLIEWPELGEPLFNFKTIKIQITMGKDENERSFEIIRP